MTYSGSRWEGERAIFFGNVEIMGEGVGIAEELSIRNGESNEVRTRIKNTLLNLLLFTRPTCDVGLHYRGILYTLSYTPTPFTMWELFY